MTNKKISAQLLKEASKALQGIAKHPNFDTNVPLREIRIHMLDEDGDGIGLWIEFNEETGEFEKGMMSIAAEMMEVGNEDDESDEWENRTLGNNEYLN